jgi:hypothetical protein
MPPTTRRATHRFSGGHSGGGTPLPIPNRAVKPASADGTRGESPRESRTPPDSFIRRPPTRRPSRFYQRNTTEGADRSTGPWYTASTLFPSGSSTYAP